MMTSNAKLGGQFERDLCNILAEKGFWVHHVARNEGGQQPADIIVAKGRYHALIDCKVVSTDRGFTFSRAEDNQRMAMSLFHLKAHEYGWFALLLPDGCIRMLCYPQLLGCESKGMKSLPMHRMGDPIYTISLDEWIRRANDASHR